MAAFNQAILLAARTPLKAFQASAAKQSVTLDQLRADPASHRGQVVTIQGTLRHLTSGPAPKELQKQGIAKVHEAWIDPHLPGINLVVVAVPMLPKALEEGKGLQSLVSFTGYFFKRNPFGKGAAQKVLLIGPTLTVIPFWLDNQRTRAAARPAWSASASR